MPLDGLLGHEQGLRDLAVGATVGSLAAYPPLRRGQRAATGQLGPRAPARPRVEIRASALAERERATPVSERDRAALGIATLPSPSETAQLAAKVGERVS